MRPAPPRAARHACRTHGRQQRGGRMPRLQHPRGHIPTPRWALALASVSNCPTCTGTAEPGCKKVCGTKIILPPRCVDTAPHLECQCNLVLSPTHSVAMLIWEVARRCKQRRYPELARPGPQRLVVSAAEDRTSSDASHGSVPRHGR